MLLFESAIAMMPKTSKNCAKGVPILYRNVKKCYRPNLDQFERGWLSLAGYFCKLIIEVLGAMMTLWWWRFRIKWALVPVISHIAWTEH